MQRHGVAAAVAGAAVTISALGLAHGEADLARREVAAVRAAALPVIDGDLGDAVWASAEPDDRFTQRFPDDAAPPSQRTEMRVAYDDSAVYFAFRLHDDAADQIVARLTRRDRAVEADSISVAIDSRHDRHSAYVFALNAAGVQQDALVSNDSELDYAWDATWSGAVRRDPSGWTAEFAIPLSVLRFSQADRQTWGLQARRYISRRREEALWAPIPRTSAQFASRMGELTGLSGLHPRRTFELRPFVVLRTRGHSRSGGVVAAMQDGAQVSTDTDAGVDLKVGVTSGLTLDATINPDFGQVEADEVVLNLTRFETSFPEKRPFFLEGREIFETPVELFYSRRIGNPPSKVSVGGRITDVDAHGAEVAREVIEAPGALPIYAAAKLSGKATEALSIGALSAVTAPEVVRVRLDDDGGEKDVRLSPARSYSVVRLRYDLGDNSYLGLIGTAALRLGDDPRGGAANHDALAQGLDGQWQSHDGVWRLTGHALATQRLGGTAHLTASGAPCPDPSIGGCAPIIRADGTRLGPGDVGWGLDLRGARRGKHWIGELSYAGYAPKLDPNAMGFLTQFNQHRFDSWHAYQVTSGRGVHRHWSVGGGGTLGLAFDGTLRLANVAATYEGELDNAWSLSAEWGARLPRTWDIVETGDGARYERNGGLGGGLVASTDPRRRVQASIDVFGGFGFGKLPGWDVSSSATLKLRPTSALELELTPRIGWEGNFVRSYFPDPCRDDAGAPCTVDTDDRHYVFSELDSGSASLTLRTIYTLSPRLSLQGYAQLFLSRGEFSRYYRVDTRGDRPRIERDDLVLDPAFAAGDDDFQDASLQLDVLLRWEPSPGSTVLAAYTRGQTAAAELAGRSPRFDPRGLGRGPVEDVFLIKFTYYAH